MAIFISSLVDLQESHCFCRPLGGDLTVAVVARFVASVLDVSAAGAQEESAAACTVSAVTQMVLVVALPTLCNMLFCCCRSTLCKLLTLCSHCTEGGQEMNSSLHRKQMNMLHVLQYVIPHKQIASQCFALTRN